METVDYKNDITHILETTVLGADVSDDAVRKLCNDAIAYGFGTVMVNPFYVRACRVSLPKDIRVGTVIDFPQGASSMRGKVAAVRAAVKDGADDLDVVAGVSLLRRSDDQAYFETLRALRKATRGRVLKIILETALLSEAELRRAVTLCTRAKADFVKTSTGFASRGASVQDIALMREATVTAAKEYGVRPCGVKASGGIRTLEDAKALIAAGATRIGTSRAVEIADAANLKKSIK